MNCNSLSPREARHQLARPAHTLRPKGHDSRGSERPRGALDLGLMNLLSVAIPLAARGAGRSTGRQSIPFGTGSQRPVFPTPSSRSIEYPSIAAAECPRSVLMAGSSAKARKVLRSRPRRCYRRPFKSQQIAPAFGPTSRVKVRADHVPECCIHADHAADDERAEVLTHLHSFDGLGSQ
jgi:hypothetical protein